ncbi:hypothetical protein GW17_00031213, partial [Ensete ventricosum]
PAGDASGVALAGCYTCGRLPPLASAAGLPCGLALATASRPLAWGLGCGPAMGGRPYMGLAMAGRPSLLPSLRKHCKNV